jgi:hypothetical protein
VALAGEHGPRIARRISALAVSGVDVVAGRVATPVDVLGDPVRPTSWPTTSTR